MAKKKSASKSEIRGDATAKAEKGQQPGRAEAKHIHGG
jgi:hypothetical protein